MWSMSIRRLILAFLIAPVATPFTFAIAFLLREGWFARPAELLFFFLIYAPFAYAVELLLGMPMVLLFRYLDWKNFVAYLIGGGLIGFLVAFFILPSFFPWSISIEDQLWCAAAGATSALLFWRVVYAKSSIARRFRHVPWAAATFLLGVVISPIHFWTESIACGLNGSSTHYRSSYLLNVWTSSTSHAVAEEAHEAFQKRLLESLEVLERGPKFDSGGQQVGERAVVIMAGHDNRKDYVVLWTDKTSVQTVRSWSLRHVLELEKSLDK